MPPGRFVKSKAVIDSSCLVCLVLLDLSFPQYKLFRALHLRYYAIYIPQHVWNEVSRRGRRRGRLHQLVQHYPFLQRCDVKNDYDAQLLYDRRRNPRAPIDRGEAEAIIQARERGLSEVLIDERKGTRIAQAHSLNTRGIVGLIKEFRLNGLIESAKPLFEECRRNRFWLNERLVTQVLKDLGEE